MSTARPAFTTYPSRDSAQAQRTARIVSARQQAKAVESATQTRYRQALVASVEAEIFEEKASWEAARAERLAALREAFARSLVLVGDAQKRATVEASAELSGAGSAVAPWGAIAAATVARGTVAAATAAIASFENARDNDIAVYRAAVTRAAADVSRRAVSPAARRRALSASRLMLDVGAPTHPLVLPGRHEATATASSRLSPFYGPAGADKGAVSLGSAGADANGRVVTGGFTRVEQGVDSASRSTIARVPWLVQREPLPKNPEENVGAGGINAAAAAAAAAASALESARTAAGKLAIERMRNARIRSTTVARERRESREGLEALSLMESISRDPVCDRSSIGSVELMPCARSGASSARARSRASSVGGAAHDNESPSSRALGYGPAAGVPVTAAAFYAALAANNDGPDTYSNERPGPSAGGVTDDELEFYNALTDDGGAE